MKIDYIVLNNDIAVQTIDRVKVEELAVAPNSIYVIQDQVIPPNSPESSAAQHRLESFAKSSGAHYLYGSTMFAPYMTQEVVQAGEVVVACDKDVYMVGAKGTLGLALGAEEMALVLAGRLDEVIALSAPAEELYVAFTGALPDELDMRTAGIKLVELLQGKVSKNTILKFVDKTSSLSLEQKMLLCSWCQKLDVKSALFAEARDNCNIEFDLQSLIRSYTLPGGLTPAGQEVVAVYLGGSHGGFLEDIKLAAEMLAGKQLARKVRLSVAPVSSEVYYRAATAGYFTTIMQAGGLILNQCALPPVQARIGAGEILVSNDIHNEENYAGLGGKIVLTDTRTAIEVALMGALEGNCPGNILSQEAAIGKETEVKVTKTAEKSAKALAMSFAGRVWKFGDDIDTDIIMPTQHLSYATMEEIKTHVFEPLRPELAAMLQQGDIIVAGNNFGCGSSREQAAEILAYAGIKAIIAKSFARIFFRNAINNGVLLIECPELPDEVIEGDIVTVNINKCIEHKGKEYPIPYLATNLYQLVINGGLVKSTQKQNGVL